MTLRERFTNNISITPLVFFRIAFGLLMAYHYAALWWSGKLREDYIEPTYHFTYTFFHWVAPLPGNGMYVLSALLVAAGIMIALGWHYKKAALLFFMGHTYVFLIDIAFFQNHWYLMSLVGFLMLFLPAAYNYSIDAWRKKQYVDKVPAWTVYIIQVQFFFVYFYAGVAKLNSDWLGGYPMRFILPRYGPDSAFDFFQQEWLILLASYYGAFLDLLIVFFLIWKKTRVIAFFAALFFNLSNMYLFNIGIFPLWMIAGTMLFFSPAFFDRLFAKIKGILRIKMEDTHEAVVYTKRLSSWAYRTLVIFFILQAVLPLRHHFYPGDVRWTQEAKDFSWTQKTNSENIVSGFLVVMDNTTGEWWWLDPTLYITPSQAIDMVTTPRLMVRFVHDIKEDLYAQFGENISVYSAVATGLNARYPQPKVDPRIDILTIEPKSFVHQDFIIPLNTEDDRRGRIVPQSVEN